MIQSARLNLATLAAIVTFFMCASSYAKKPVVAETIAGLVSGEENNGIYSFKGIPYGASTAGAMRFKPPHPVKAWEGVRDGRTFGPICPQTGPVATGQDPKTSSGYSMTGVIEKLPISEDCLVLNVWTPATDGKRPVMVWYHGRGYAQGAGSEDWYDGTALAKRGDVVVVTVNHRLNVFGYLHAEEIGGETFAGSGMAGMLDAALALQWVRDNIAEFGGDPNNVTIFGESGGGAKVSTLLAMPSAKGLFHKAIIQSGAGLMARQAEEATAHAEQLFNQLGLEPGDMAGLQNLPLEKILAAASATGERFRPVMEGRYLPRQPFDKTATQWSVDIPIMIGTNKDESALFNAADPKLNQLTEAELRTRVEEKYGDLADKLLAAYRENRPSASPWDRFITLESDAAFRIPSIKLAEAQLAVSTAPVYMYLVGWETNYGGGIFKSPHAVEIALVFSHVDRVPLSGDKPDRFEMEAAMSEAWIAFARTGDPNHSGIPTWKPYSLDSRETLYFDVPAKLVNDPHRSEREAWLLP